MERVSMLAAATYLVVIAAIGVWAWRRTRDERDFFIAGQRAGLWATGLATTAASFSSFVFLGGPGLMARAGLGSLFIILPAGFTAGLLCRVVGSRLRQLSGGGGVMTVPEALDARFPGGTVRGLAAAAILLGVVAYLGLQLQGIALLLRSLLGVADPDLALAVGLLVILAYSVAGGMVAGLYTDVFQGALMVVAALAVFARAMAVGGGWSHITATLAAHDPAFLEPAGRLPAITAIGFFLVFGVGVLGQPHLLHKFFMIRDPTHVRWLPLVFGGSQLACLTIWLGIGLAVPALVASGGLPPLAEPDQATPLFLAEFLPGVLGGVLVAAILAASMSTADSFLNIGAAAVARDLPRALGRPLAREFVWARLAVPAIALAALLFSRAYATLIALVGTFAFGAFAAALAPALVVGLWWRRVDSRAAAASIATGLLAAALFEFVPGVPLAPGALPAAAALAASFVVLLAVAWLAPRKT